MIDIHQRAEELTAQVSGKVIKSVRFGGQSDGGWGPTIYLDDGSKIEIESHEVEVFSFVPAVACEACGDKLDAEDFKRATGLCEPCELANQI